MARRARHLTNRTRLEELVADRCLPSLAGRSIPDLARRLPQQNHVWVEARRRFRLSHTGADGTRARNESEEARQARKRSSGALEGTAPKFIESLYVKRFGREWPAVLLSAEERAGQAGRVWVCRSRKPLGPVTQRRVLFSPHDAHGPPTLATPGSDSPVWPVDGFTGNDRTGVYSWTPCNRAAFSAGMSTATVC